jgi:hypothetical protein
MHHLHEKDFLHWFFLHGLQAAELFPRLREQKHLEHKGPITRAMEEEWCAIEQYDRDIAEAQREFNWRVKRAGERYLWVVSKLKRQTAGLPALSVPEGVHGSPHTNGVT